jgi:uncharacterized protein YndB with AHSA1/START domain
MSVSRWHRIYSVRIAAAPQVLFDLLADLPEYGRWLPGSESFGSTTDVEPYPVQPGTRYRDGKPGEAGRDWQGTVTGFQPPGSLDFHQVIPVPQLRGSVDVHVHYTLEPEDGGTRVERWLILDVAVPLPLRPLRAAVTSRFDKENVRLLAALKQYAERAGDHDDSAA